MEKLLTIVVPAYNVEKYIKNCLDSFIDLSVLRSLEILIVDDGSTDSTASLAHTYEQKYPYLSLIHILRAHETDSYLVCRLLLEKKKKKE